MAGPRTLLLLLLITFLILDCVSAKRKKPCKYNKKKYKAGQVAEAIEDNCVELRCSKRGKIMELVPIRGCKCCKKVTKPPKATPKPTDKPTNKPTDKPTNKPTEPPGGGTCDYTPFGATHTMNLAKNPACAYHKNSVSDDDIITILKTHNDLRAKVANGLETQGDSGPQPSATNMKELRWNSQLAEVAQAWAEQCPGGHDTGANRKICDPTYYVGQNMYWSWSFDPATAWVAAINAWYGEVKDMPSTLVDSFGSPGNGRVIGHYTQVVWADTYEVGCGAVHYPETLSNIDFPEAKAYVCNYGPGGNWLSSPVYESGAPASNCPDGTSSEYPGLCA